jgi:ribosome-associated translation inhibitor RaiA
VKAWTLDGEVITGNKTDNYTLNLTGDATVTVEFELVTYAVTFNVAGSNGTLKATVDGAEITSIAQVQHGKSVVFTATPSSNYRVKEWTLNGAVIAGNTDNSYTLPDVAAEATVTVEFEQDAFAVTFSVTGGNGTLKATVDGTEITSGTQVQYGKSVVFTATPNSNYLVKAWTLDGTVISGNTTNSYTLPDLADDATVTVQFELVTYAVTFNVVGSNGTLKATVDGAEITSGAQVQHGKTVIFTAIPNTNYRVKEWTLNSAAIAGNMSNSYTLQELTAAVTVTVNFVEELLFDKYVATKWNNTFVLNIKQLKADKYELNVNDPNNCKWYKDGIEIGRGFSYYKSNTQFEAGVAYTFVLNTTNHGEVYSTEKVFGNIKVSVLAYPNPVRSGNILTIEGVDEGSPLRIFNQAGVCVSNTIVTGSPVQITLPVPSGIYLIHTANGELKIVVE